METTTTTSNPLLRVKTEDLEQVLTARKTIRGIAQKYGLSPRPHQEQITNNNNNGHNGHHRKSRMAQSVRNRISVGMKRRWAERKREKKQAPAEQTAAAPA